MFLSPELIHYRTPKHIANAADAIRESSGGQLSPEALMIGQGRFDIRRCIAALGEPLHANLPLVASAPMGTMVAVPHLVYDIEARRFVQLVEVSNRGPTDEALRTAAFKAFAMMAAGMRVGRVSIASPNKTYVVGDDIRTLFEETDVTDRVFSAEMRDAILDRMRGASDALLEPDMDKLQGCEFPTTCPCPERCHPKLAPYSIYDILRVKQTQLDILREHLGGDPSADILRVNLGNAGLIRTLKAARFQDGQFQQISDAQTMAVRIDRPGLRKFLRRIRWPLKLLDYETITRSIPFYPGFHSGEDMPCQASVHTIESPRALLAGSSQWLHDGFLLDQNDMNPEESLLQFLSGVMEPRGSSMAWTMQFEQRQNRTMSQRNPRFRAMLEALNEDMVDLEEPFRRDKTGQALYVHHRFKGRSRLKFVQPVIAPDEEYSYARRRIRNGEMATAAIKRMLWTQDAAEREQIRSDELDYCGNDTAVMGAVLAHLWQEAQMPV